MADRKIFRNSRIKHLNGYSYKLETDEDEDKIYYYFEITNSNKEDQEFLKNIYEGVKTTTTLTIYIKNIINQIYTDRTRFSNFSYDEVDEDSFYIEKFIYKDGSDRYKLYFNLIKLN